MVLIISLIYYIGLYITILLIGILQLVYTQDVFYILYPLLNFIVLKTFVFSKINKLNIKKETIKIPFLCITTLFNGIFYFLQSYPIEKIIYIIIVHILEYCLIKDKVQQKEKIEKETMKNIEEYFIKKDHES